MRTLQPATVHVARLIHKKIELCIADIISACGCSDLAAIEEEALHLEQRFALRLREHPEDGGAADEADGGQQP